MTFDIKQEFGPELIKSRDAGMPTFTFFWAIDKKVVSPYFDSEEQAIDWMDVEKYKAEAQSLWSDSCTTKRKINGK